MLNNIHSQDLGILQINLVIILLYLGVVECIS